MPQLLFRLSQVGEDEAEKLRQLLMNNDIAFYEPGAGFWGTGIAAIWLERQEQFSMARELLDNYQINRSETFQQAWLQQKINGEQRGWRERFVEQPLKTILFVFLAGLVAYISVKPFVDMMD